MAAAFALLLAAAHVHAAPAGPVLTRVVDPANPATTDVYESGGAAWLDLNGDGYLDLFVPHGNLSNQNNSLYLHTTGMAFQKVVTGPEVADGGTSIGAMWGDWNQDGHPDLFVVNRSDWGNFLYAGTGDTTFTKITGQAVENDQGDSNSGSWIDIDGDGDLDLYVVNFNGDDFLYLNSGPPDYTLTRTVVPSLTPGSEFSIHGAWADFDNDGDEDLFTCNAGTQNDYLFVNGGALSFTKRVLGDGLSSLGASWGDYDNDGYLDLFVTHHGQPGVLYHNSGPPNFDLTPMSTAVFPADVSNGVGSAWGDVDNDGDLDLFVANDGGNNFLYLNGGPPGYAFTRVTTGAAVNDGGNSFGCSWADVNRDGALDLFVANRANQVNFLYRNDGPVGNWLGVRCIGTLSNASAVGAIVRVLATLGGVPRWQMQQVTPLTGYNSQNLELHFGLGDAAIVDSVVVRWPSGHVDVLADHIVNQLVTITEGEATSGVSSALPRDGVTLRLASPNPARGALALQYTLPHAERVTLDLLDVTGRRLALLQDRVEDAGLHGLHYDRLGSVPPGVCWCRLRAGTDVRTVRLAVVH